MPSDSRDSESCRATASDFRQTRLSRANIRFEEHGYTTPEYVSQVIALLAHWPPSPKTEQPVQALVLPNAPDEETELRNAADLAQQVHPELIHELTAQYESDWMMDLYRVLLSPLLESAKFRLRELSKTSKVTWTEGPSFAGLPNPQPDLAFGLARSKDESSPLSKAALDSLDDPSRVQATYSPDILRSLIYPSFIFEAKSDQDPIFSAENELAVGAASALAMLNELSSLSRTPFQHCVILAATMGTEWRLFVAYRDVNPRSAIHIVPVLSPLHVEYFAQRQRLSYIVNRIKAWMLGPYHAKVCEQLRSVQQFHKEQLQPSDSDENDGA